MPDPVGKAPLLGYANDAAGKGRFAILRHPDGVEFILRKHPARLAVDIALALLFSPPLLIAAVVPSGVHTFLGNRFAIWLAWWGRPFLIAASVVVAAQAYRGWQERHRVARIVCRRGRIDFTRPEGSKMQTYQIDWNRIHDLYAGQTDDDNHDFYIGVVDAAKEEQQLMIGWLDRYQAIYVGRVLRRMAGVPAHRQDSPDFDEDCDLALQKIKPD